MEDSSDSFRKSSQAIKSLIVEKSLMLEAIPKKPVGKEKAKKLFDILKTSSYWSRLDRGLYLSPLGLCVDRTQGDKITMEGILACFLFRVYFYITDYSEAGSYMLECLKKR